MMRIAIVVLLFLFCGCVIFPHGFNLRRAIESRENFVGLTKEKVQKRFGNPDSAHCSYGQYGIHETWVYNYKGSIGTWTMEINFLNEKVISIDYF